MENNTNDILREQEEVGGLNQVIDSATANEDVSVREDFTASAGGVELTSLRGANWKVFDMGHGRRQAIYYAEPVHYPSGGRFVDIDNRLTLDRSANVMRSASNAFAAAVACKDEGKPVITLRRDGVDFALSYYGEPAGVTGAVLPVEAAANAAELTAHARLSETLHSGMTYSELRPGMDVEIRLTGNGVKDILTLRSPDAQKYACLVLPEGFDYAQDANGNTLVLRDGKEYITIFAPYAFDAHGLEVPVRTVLEERYLRYELEDEAAAYPVTIDPYVTYSNSTGGMDSVYIASHSPNKGYITDYLCTGVHTGESGKPEFVSLLKPRSLVPQKSSDTILSAKLYMRVSGLGGKQWFIGAFPVKTPWTEKDTTWNSMSPGDDTHISKELLSYISNIAEQKWGYFDITETYKSWYRQKEDGSHSNYGVAIRRACAATYNSANFYSTRASEGNPYIVVNYVSHAGRKGWWKYESMGTGRAGSVYADIYNGNLIAEHADTATSGNRMPVSVSHIYNSCLSDENAARCGLGWRLSVNHSLREETIVGKNFYIWQDGDGTEHYFEKTSKQPYADSEGMQLKLKVTDTAATITDKSDTVMSFPVPAASARSYLSTITDVHGNTMTLTYDENIPGKVNSITDGVGRATVLAYNADGLLASITAPGRPVVSYAYDGSAENGWRLREVHYGDLEANQYTEYGYDTRDGAPTATLTMLRNFDGTQTNVVYDANLDTAAIGSYSEQMRRVVSLERTNGTIKGAKTKITYGHMHTIVTAVSDPENDETGKSLIYHFNSAGNVISTHDEMWHAVAAEYKSGIDNTPSATSNLIKTVINRVVSPDFASGWSQTKACSTDTYARDTGTRCMNLPSAKIVKKGAGELKHKTTVKLFESGEYTLSAYLKTTGLTVTSGYKGAFLRVTANGTVYESRPALTSTAGAGVGTFASGWERLSVCFPFEYGEDTSVAIELVCDAKSGTLYWSCPQVESGRMANAFNLVTDGDFSLTTNNTAASTTRLFPKQWKVTGNGVSTSTLNCIVTDRAVNGLPDSVSGNAMRLTCKPSATDVYIAQDINARGAKGDVFTVSGWCSSLSVASGYSTFQPRIGVRFRTGSGNEYSGWQRFNFSTNRSGWNCISAQVAAPKDFYSIQIGVFYGRNANTGMFSHISLTRELYGNVYTYDANGNVTAVKDLSNQKSAATYDSFNNLLSYVQPGSATTEKYLFTYGSTDAEKKRHLPLTSTTPTGVKTTMEYNAYGSYINATVQENASAPLIRTETEYTEDGNFVTKQRDARGNEVVNALDANGKLLSVTDPSGQSVNYGYDDSNRVTSVQASYTVNGESRISRNEYTYENDRLKTVAHNTTSNTADVVYNFEYDELGRKTTVKVGNQALSTNVYSPDRKSRLEEVQYGNGGKVKYTYDDFDRVIGVGYDNDESPRFNYEYDSKGRAAFVKDSTDGSTVRTGYDQTDRPNETEQRDGEGNLKYRTLIEYDKKNRVKAFNEATADQSFKTEYTYDADNRVTKVRYNSSDTSKVDYVYDKLNRITSRTVTNGTSSYATQFAYAPGATMYGENATTPLVSSITQGEGENAMNFAYTYDNRGNITSETRNGLTTTYVYDALGQLIRVNDPHENATWIYSYDRGGNILNKAKYAYTIADELGEAVESIPYTYGDANWKDKLTAYNGVPITYDAMGNPLNDGTWTYEWQAGRQLKSMSNTSTGETVEFTYNHTGCRTKKVRKINGVAVETTEYLRSGRKIIRFMCTDHVENKAEVMQFIYDARGKIVMTNFNGTVYRCIYNLQGDVVGMLDNVGAVVVEYKYDSWGKLLTIDGSLSSTLGRRNPFRYRGYVYDEEVSLYYMKNRYYNPNWNRFLNADNYVGKRGKLLSHDMFVYCINMPVILADENGQDSTLVAKADYVDSDVIAESYLDAVDDILGRKYASRGGKLLSYEVSEEYISKDEEDSHNDFVEDSVKWAKRGYGMAVGYVTGGGVTDAVASITKHVPSAISQLLTWLGGWVAEDIEGEITDFIVDSYSIKQGKYKSIRAKFQYEHRHFFFFKCRSDYASYEIRNYDNTYYEVWFNAYGCYTRTFGSQKVGARDYGR